MTYNYAYRKRYYLDKALGRPRSTPAGPVRDHITQLRTLGWSWRGIADAAQVSMGTAHTILHSGQPTVRTTTARRILALRPESIHQRPNVDGFVPATGTRRRIRALLAIGWPHHEMRARSGIYTAVTVNQTGESVTRHTRDTIAALYDDLSMTPGPSSKTRGRAKALGYAPPLAWDDDTIEDPDARPNLGKKRRKSGRTGVDLDEFLWLIRSGENPQRAADRLGVQLDTVAETARRHDRIDVLSAMRRDLAA